MRWTAEQVKSIGMIYVVNIKLMNLMCTTSIQVFIGCVLISLYIRVFVDNQAIQYADYRFSPSELLATTPVTPNADSN